ncbi:MAG: glutamine--fructose-6-phosphate transaminase (isomerizing), partial [Methanobrevibacter sp.]|nr:glutamine--fructose-6-phosphate transaminase (isomerizing) [Methanobrevibacter sp.]
MCGIVGYISKEKKVAPILLEAVKKLEYRGYDSVGIATLVDGQINIKKGNGQIADVDKRLDFAKMDGNIGIAHVRWATHGEPSKANAHPHTDCDNEIAIVHNGIIHNYVELKEELIANGHQFRSETDSEVIPHLIEKFVDEGKDLQGALIETIKLLKGSYAIGAISKSNPEEIVAVRKESPLVVGIGNYGNFIASDVPAFLEYTKEVIFPEDNEIVTITTDGVKITDLNGNILEKEVTTVDWDEEAAQKGDYPHFMIKEINEQPNAISDTLTIKNDVENVITDIGEINRICFVACGTSYHAALTGKYLFERFAHIPTDVILASEFPYF